MVYFCNADSVNAFRIMKNIFVLMSCILSFVSSVKSQNSNFIPGEYIVQLAKPINAQRLQWLPTNTSMETLTSSPMHLAILKYDVQKCNENDIINWLNTSSNIVQYQRNHIISARIVPDDPQLSAQYHLINATMASVDIDADKAWDITTGGMTYDGKKVVIAIIDNGISTDHPDLAPNLWKNEYEIPNNDVDDDGNGYVDDVNGWNVTTNTDFVNNMANHGSQVAGVAGARGNNGIGITGVMWQTEMMIVNYGSPNEANAIIAYSYVYSTRKLYNQTNGQKGAFVVASNSSWGRDRVMASDAPLWCAMYDSLGSVGIINCVATTNQNIDVDSEGDMPSSCNSQYMISVNSISKTDTKNPSTGYGKKSIDIGSYGSEIVTTANVDYSFATGTSVATPILTGIAGLMYSTSCGSLVDIARIDPARAARIARDIILNSTVPLPSLEDISTTGGKANAHRVLENTLKLCNCQQSIDVKFVANAKTVTVDFDTNLTGQQIDLRIRPANQTIWETYTSLSPQSVINNLALCTDYEIQIKNKCGIYSSEYGYSQYVKTQGCCELPRLLVENVDDTQIGLKWISAETQAEYNVQYRAINNAEWTTINIKNTETTILGLVPCQKYEVRIQISCPENGNESGYSTPTLVSTACGNCTNIAYCSFKPKNDSFEWFENTQFGPLQVTGHQLGNSGYKDYTGEYNPVFEIGKTYNYNTTIKYKDDVTTPEYLRIYIDYNQDGDFTEDEEIAKATNQINLTFNKEITLPLDAKLGYTKMRQMLMYDQFAGSCDNTVFKFGEVEDFCIQIENPDCPQVSKATITNITKVGATVRLEQDGTDELTTVFGYRKKGSSLWLEITAKDSIVLTGLDSCANYEYTVVTKCTAGQSSPSSKAEFKTGCNSNVNDNSADPDFNIWPNPGTDVLHLKISNYSQKPTELSILNSLGKVVKTIQATGIIETTIIDTSSLPSGLFYVQIRLEMGQTKSAKWIKF